ncbi:DIV1B protein, partial [Trifolium medium]|nr:DIV1B protein [Trifolium medium]
MLFGVQLTGGTNNNNTTNTTNNNNLSQYQQPPPHVSTSANASNVSDNVDHASAGSRECKR